MSRETEIRLEWWRIAEQNATAMLERAQREIRLCLGELATTEQLQFDFSRPNRWDSLGDYTERSDDRV